MRPPGAGWMPAGLILSLGLILTGCGSGPSSHTRVPTGAATTAAAAAAAVQLWLGHLASHADTRAFADLAPLSQAAVGDLDNYRRGSSEFGSTYVQFAPPAGSIGPSFILRPGLALVMLRTTGPRTAGAAVPVRQVGTQWRVDPILGVGDYAFRPAEGATVGSRPTFTAQFDPGVVARVWFDGTEGVATSTTTFRSQQVLAPGWHVVTAVLQRGRDVVARTVDLEVVG